ncbi:surface antigen 2 (CA-2), partial [Trypanosoma cruzi]
FGQAAAGDKPPLFGHAAAGDKPSPFGQAAAGDKPSPFGQEQCLMRLEALCLRMRLVLPRCRLESHRRLLQPHPLLLVVGLEHQVLLVLFYRMFMLHCLPEARCLILEVPLVLLECILAVRLVEQV